MKIIEPGKKPESKPKPWWAGMQLVCSACGCKFELEERDSTVVLSGLLSAGRPFSIKERRPDWNSTTRIMVDCPTCDTGVYGDRPTQIMNTAAG